MSTWPEPPNYYDTPSKGYKVMLQQPGFPVIYPEPNVTQVGAPIHWQKPASMFGTVFMGQFGLLHMMQDSAYRLMGFKENALEVRSNMPGLLAKESY